MHPYLLPGLKLGPVVLSRLVAKIPESDYDKPLGPDRFTPREVVAHLADWEPIMRARIQAAVDNPGSSIKAYDEGQMAIDNDYASKQVAEELQTFVMERSKTAEYVAAMAPDQLKGTVFHSERGEMSGNDLANLLVGHDMYHAEQLSAYLERD